jgi:endonuclease YncB( thermonuclease family)
MRRRTLLTSLAASVGGVTAISSESFAADAALDCGVWYDAEITDSIDGDTFDVYVYDNDTEYNVRTLGHDSPEKSGNTRYEKTEEWEFIEDATHLENWGNEASQFAADELPVGTACQVKLDCESEEVDQYGRLLAKVRYDRSGDGSMDTVWNELTVEQGYARVYAASMSNADEYVDLQRSARANGRGVWAADDGSASEWRNDDVAETFHPHTSSIRTTSGALPDARAPVWAESTGVQENTTSSTVDYDAVPLVGVDEPNNLAYFGGVPINERWESDAAALEQFVFVANLVDYLHDSSDPTGPYLVDGGHHTFGQDNAVSAEDVAYFQRFLEGVGVELHSINTYGDATGYSLSEARALVASSGPDAWTSAEVSEVRSFLDGGGVVLLMGSGSETSGERANVDALVADLGTDLRLNEDDVRDDTNNVGTRKLLKTANRNTADFSLWSAYGTSGGGSDAVVEFGAVEQYPAATLNDEYVELTNTGSGDQDMTGWTLRNGDGDTYAFPDGFTLTAGGTVRVHTGSGTDASSDGDLYWGASTFRWDDDADTAAVYDGDGSLVRETSWDLADVAVTGLDPDDEWVDFENRGGTSVDMAGWAVEDAAGNHYDFPSDVSLAAGDTVRLHSGSGTDSSTDLYWGDDYIWNNDGDTCLLYDDAGEVIERYEYPAPYSVSVPEISLSGDTLNDEYVDLTNDGSTLLELSGWTLEDEAGYTYAFPDSFTLGAVDTVRVHTGDGTDTATDLYWGRGTGVWNDDGDTAYVYDEDERLAVSETASTSGGTSTIDVAALDEEDEWVDFDNVGSSGQDMTGWTVEDEAGNAYTFPDSFVLNAGDTVRLHSGDGTDTSTDLYWGNDYIWNNSGDTCYLYESDGTLHDSLSY